MGKSPIVLLGMLRCADVVLVIVLALLCYWLRHGYNEMPPRYCADRILLRAKQ